MLKAADGLFFDSEEDRLERKIFDLFRAAGSEFVSGESLSGVLGVSRTAVWKRISHLKNLGYDIESAPARGYRLGSSPDILYPSEIASILGTPRIGRRIVSFSRTASTNTAAFALAEQGAAEGTVVVADAQESGKGRMGRKWESPEGVNLYCSVILRPPILPLNASQLTFVSAVAVARAVRSEGLQPQIKWPNDVLLGGAKVAGLLNEMSCETDKVNFVVLGIGVNLNMRREQFPPDLRYPGTSVFMESGVTVSRKEFFARLMRELDELYGLYLNGSYARIREEWLSSCDIHGKTVRVASSGTADRTGTVEGIDEDGALLLRTGSGVTERVLSGDVTIVS